MAKIIVYNVSSQALEVYHRSESETMPYVYGNTMKVKERPRSLITCLL